MTDNIKPTVQEKTAWAKVPQEFNDWWNGEYSDESNPFRFNSAAYWAWAGWSEAVRLNAQAVPDGWVLVPVEATLDMLDAFRNHDDSVLGPDFLGAYRAMLSAAPAAPQADAKPMFWVRLCSDGCYEGPIHDSSIEDVRKQSGAWHPLYLAAPAAPQPAQQPLTDGQFQKIRRSLMQQSGWDGDGWDQALKEAIEQALGIGVKND